MSRTYSAISHRLANKEEISLSLFENTVDEGLSGLAKAVLLGAGN